MKKLILILIFLIAITPAYAAASCQDGNINVTDSNYNFSAIWTDISNLTCFGNTSTDDYVLGNGTSINLNITSGGEIIEENKTLYVNGNITIYGNMTFRNVTIIMNGTTDGEYQIESFNNSVFNLTESNITNGYNDTFNYIVFVNRGTNFSMTFTSVDRAGYNYSEPRERGLEINATAINFSYNTLTNNLHGVTFYSDYNTIEHNIANYTFMHGFLIEENTRNNSLTNNTIENNHGVFTGSYTISSCIYFNRTGQYHTARNNNCTNTTIYGIYLSTTSNSTIENNTLTNVGRAIYISVLSDSNNIINNTVQDNGFGIRIAYSNYNNVTDNIARNNSWYGIELQYESGIWWPSTFNRISNNTIYNNSQYGIYMRSSYNNTFSNNTVYDNGGGIYHHTSYNNTLSNNTVYDSIGDGIRLYNSTDEILSGNNLTNNNYNFHIECLYDYCYNHTIDSLNTVNEKPIIYKLSVQDYSPSANAGFFGCIYCDNITVNNSNFSEINYHGILFWKTNNSIIENTTANSNNIGIFVSYSENNTVRNVTANSNYGAGVKFDYSNNSTIQNIKVNRSYAQGVTTRYSNNSIIQNITVNNSGIGIYFWYSNNSIIQNITSDNNDIGVYLHKISAYNTVSNVTISNNNNVGIPVYGGPMHNTFSNITIYPPNSSSYADYASGLTPALINNTLDITFGKDSEYETKALFQSSNYMSIINVLNPPSTSGFNQINKYLNITNTSAYYGDKWIYINISYNDSELGSATESELRLYRHNGTDWILVEGSAVDTVNNYVYANITNFSIFGVLDYIEPSVSPPPSGEVGQPLPEDIGKYINKSGYGPTMNSSIQSNLTLYENETGSVILNITRQGNETCCAIINITGIPDEWLLTNLGQFSIDVNETKSINLTFNPDKEGEYPINITIITPDINQTLPFKLIVLKGEAGLSCIKPWWLFVPVELEYPHCYIPTWLIVIPGILYYGYRHPGKGKHEKRKLSVKKELRATEKKIKNIKNKLKKMRK